MNNFVKVYEEIKRRKENLERGGINSIPFPFRGFNKVIPGIIPETQTTLTTVSGAGKTLFSTNIYVQHPFNYWMENKDNMDIDVEIFLFCLEDSIELTTKRMIIRQLWEQCGIRLSMFKLNSYFQGDKLDDETLKAINSLNPYFEKFFSKVHLIDNVRNPFGIYSTVREWLERPENGHIVDEHGNKLNPAQIKEAQDLGVLDGVTTNPSLMAKEGIAGEAAVLKHYVDICNIVDGDVSAEVISTDYEGMIREGEELAELDDKIVVKIPMIKDGIKALKYFSDRGIKTNCTLVFSAGQALLAAKAGATYVSPFVGRLDDISFDGIELIEQIRLIYDNEDENDPLPMCKVVDLQIQL
jgi:TalC/MipB family fructose-6-phosphate aldolase